MEYPVVQFVRPNGRKRRLSWPVPAAIEVDAKRCLDAGYNRFEVEVLQTGEVAISLSFCGDEDGERELGPELVAASDNRPGNDAVGEACARLIAEAVSILPPSGREGR